MDLPNASLRVVLNFVAGNVGAAVAESRRLVKLLRRSLDGFGSAEPAPTQVRTSDPESPENWIGLDYIHDQVVAQMEEQSKLWENADGRLRLILGVIGIVFAAVLGLLPRGTITVMTAAGPITEPQYVPFWTGSAAIAAIGCFATAGVIATVAYWPRDFNWPPAPDSLRKYLTTDPREIKLTVLDEMLTAYDQNRVWLGRKFVAFRWAFSLTAIATALLGVAVIMQILVSTRAPG
ncbi:MAG: hypothetical protein HYX52_02545 [Chloroflexi bacterium]|nr:hypothetical protein [Chloroflexota bacterium]